MVEVVRRPVLEGVAQIAHGGIVVSVVAPLARWIVRGDAAAAAGVAFGVPLPASPCRAATLGGRAALWLGPDEWLLLAPEGEVAMPDIAGSVVDIGHRQVALRLEGSRSASVLNGGCPLDLHGDAFPVGMCTRTVFGKSEIVLWRYAGDGFHVEVARSFAGYVHALLGEIAAEFGE